MDFRSASKPGVPRIEVAVPSYNHAPFVEMALRSIFAQTLRPARLLVIDDGSQDDSIAIIERTLSSAPFECELVSRPNRGLCATLNEALARTSGDYFAYLGSDDAWEPSFLATTSALLDAQPDAVLAYGHAWILDGTGARVGCTRTFGTYHGGDMRRSLLAGLSVPKSPTVMHRRSAVSRFSWNEASRLEDYEMYLKLSGVGAFAHTPEVVGCWRAHGTNVSKNVDFMLQNTLDAHDRIGPSLGVSERDLERTRQSLLFRTGDYYLEVGERTRALELTLRGLRGAGSATGIARRLVKLGTPRGVWTRLRGR